jgi:hypothetical protein
VILKCLPDEKTRRFVGAWFRRDAKLEDVEWLLDQGCSGYEVERAFPRTGLLSLERLAQRHNRYDLARRVHHLAMDKSNTATHKTTTPTRYDRYREAS